MHSHQVQCDPSRTVLGRIYSNSCDARSVETSNLILFPSSLILVSSWLLFLAVLEICNLSFLSGFSSFEPRRNVAIPLLWPDR